MVSSEQNSWSVAEDRKLGLTPNPDLPLQLCLLKELTTCVSLCCQKTDLPVKNNRGKLVVNDTKDHRTFVFMFARTSPEVFLLSA